MKKAKCILDKDFTIGKVDPRLYGSFIEHMGRAVYSGIYEPDHPTADEQGFRKDVIKIVRDLQVPIVRYPGGNFLSGYNWTDGIGPKEGRPTRLELAWLATETNEVGLDEFMDWCKKVESEAMIAVNLGTGTPQDAGYMIEYCNHVSGTYWSDLRRKNGHEQPHNIKKWCLGNEMDGPWQICHLNAEDYGKKALETSKIMKWVDPSIELVACGSSFTDMVTYPEWDRIALEYLYDHVDYISLHRYDSFKGDVGDFLGSFAAMDNQIHTVKSTADYVKAKKRSNKTMKLSFDEWNIWYGPETLSTCWQKAPTLCEDNYTLLDSLTVGGLLCTLLRNSDRVKMACIAQLVNALSPLTTMKNGPVLKHATFYPFQQVSTYGRGEVLNPVLKCPTFETKAHGNIPILQTAATFNEQDKSINLFVLNCDQVDDIELQLDLRAFEKVKLIEHSILDNSDLFAVNSFEEPEKVKPRKYKIQENQMILPKLSWNMFRYTYD